MQMTHIHQKWSMGSREYQPRTVTHTVNRLCRLSTHMATIQQQSARERLHLADQTALHTSLITGC